MVVLHTIYTPTRWLMLLILVMLCYQLVKESPIDFVLCPLKYSMKKYFSFLIFIVENIWDSFDVIYYEYGSVVLTYNSKETATRVFKLLQNSSFDEKNLYVMLLPNIQVNISLSATIFSSKNRYCQPRKLWASHVTNMTVSACLRRVYLVLKLFSLFYPFALRFNKLWNEILSHIFAEQSNNPSSNLGTTGQNWFSMLPHSWWHKTSGKTLYMSTHRAKVTLKILSC